VASGAGTILGQGGKAESAKVGIAKSSSIKLEVLREKFFAEICPKGKRSPKKKKGLRRIRSVFLSQK